MANPPPLHPNSLDFDLNFFIDGDFISAEPTARRLLSSIVARYSLGTPKSYRSSIAALALPQVIIMAKDTKLRIVNSTSGSTGLSAPAALGAAGRRVWTDIMADYQITDIGGLIMLEEICRARDTIAECDTAIKRDGATIRTKTGLKEHPMQKVKLAAQALMIRTLQRLGLDAEPIKAVGRPERGY